MSTDPSHTHNGSRPVSTIANEIESEIATREKQLARIRAEMARLEAEVIQLRNARSAINLSPDSSPGSALAGSRNSDEKQPDAEIIRRFARQAILGAGRPLNRGELLKMMSDAGLTLSAREPARRIGKVLWKSPDFTSEADGYWLADRPIPTA